MKISIPNITKILEKRMDEVGKVRDKLRDDISGLQDLEEKCNEAYDNINRAIDALSELA